MFIFCEPVWLPKSGLILKNAQSANQHFSQRRLIPAGNENDSRVGYRRGGFAAGERDDRKTASDAGDGAASAARDGASHEEQDGGLAQKLFHLRLRPHSRDLKRYSKTTPHFLHTRFRGA